MRQALTVLLILAVVWAVVKFFDFAKTEVARHEQADTSRRYAPGKLPGLPAELEDSLAAAQREGANAFRRWIAQHRAQIGEPRLTEIELDFVVLTGRTNPGEARGVLNLIKKRIKPDHPQHKRFQQLDQAYP